MLRGYQLGDDSVPVGHEHRLTACSEAHVLAELVLEDLEADGPHETEVAPGSYLVNRFGERGQYRK